MHVCDSIHSLLSGLLTVFKEKGPGLEYWQYIKREGRKGEEGGRDGEREEGKRDAENCSKAIWKEGFPKRSDQCVIGHIYLEGENLRNGNAPVTSAKAVVGLWWNVQRLRKHRSEYFLHFSRILSSFPFHFVPSCTIAHAWFWAHFFVLLILKCSSGLLASSILTFRGDDFFYRHRQSCEHLFALFMLGQHLLCRYFVGMLAFVLLPLNGVLYFKNKIFYLYAVLTTSQTD